MDDVDGEVGCLCMCVCWLNLLVVVCFWNVGVGQGGSCERVEVWLPNKFSCFCAFFWEIIVCVARI